MKIPCPNCNHEIEIDPASLLGSLGKGKKKTVSTAALAQRQAAGEATRAKWAAKKVLADAK